MEEVITIAQLKKMSKVFKRSKRTFRELTIESGLSQPSDHVLDLTKEQARNFLRHYSYYLIQPKEKQQRKRWII
jgi:hypothetical protein